MRDLIKTILAQYAHSPALLDVIYTFNDALDPDALIDRFYNDVWNVDTAKGYGLDVWGRIVGVSRVIPADSVSQYLGFADTGNLGFGQAPFYGIHQQGDSWILADDAFRLLIMLKAASNLTDTSFASYNRLLMKLFEGRGAAALVQWETMVCQIVLTFPVTPIEISLLKYSGAFTPPTGVTFNLLSAPQYQTFGFAGTSAATFGYGTFFSGYL